MNTLKPRIASLLQQLNERVFEKEHIVALALLSAVAGESIFLLGLRSASNAAAEAQMDALVDELLSK